MLRFSPGSHSLRRGRRAAATLRGLRAWCRHANDRAGSVTQPRSDFGRALFLISRNGVHPITILVSGPSRRSNRSMADFVIETHPAVGPKLSRTKCRNTALPRPAMHGELL